MRICWHHKTDEYLLTSQQRQQVFVDIPKSDNGCSLIDKQKKTLKTSVIYLFLKIIIPFSRPCFLYSYAKIHLHFITITFMSPVSDQSCKVSVADVVAFGANTSRMSLGGRPSLGWFRIQRSLSGFLPRKESTVCPAMLPLRRSVYAVSKQTHSEF